MEAIGRELAEVRSSRTPELEQVYKERFKAQNQRRGKSKASNESAVSASILLCSLEQSQDMC